MYANYTIDRTRRNNVSLIRRTYTMYKMSCVLAQSEMIISVCIFVQLSVFKRFHSDNRAIVTRLNTFSTIYICDRFNYPSNHCFIQSINPQQFNHNEIPFIILLLSPNNDANEAIQIINSNCIDCFSWSHLTLNVYTHIHSHHTKTVNIVVF